MSLLTYTIVLWDFLGIYMGSYHGSTMGACSIHFPHATDSSSEQSELRYFLYYLLFISPYLWEPLSLRRIECNSLTTYSLGINAFLYMTLGRMINFYLPEKRLAGISARRFGVIFVCLDILAFIVQLGGASLTTGQTGDNHLVMIGLHIYMGGIGLQEFFILSFVALTIHLHWKMVQMVEANEISTEKIQQRPFPWRWLFYTIYVALSLITVGRRLRR